MLLKFTKMQGTGNDFVVFDAISQNVKLSPAQLQFIGNRHFGVGCDQILLLEKPVNAAVDFFYRIFNADGSEIEQCGNGARCVARFAQLKKLTDKTDIRVETKGGMISLHLAANNHVVVNMGEPRLEPASVPFAAEKRELTYPLTVGAETRRITALSMGNPHAVQFVDDVDSAPVAVEGPVIERHPRFLAGANAGFVQVLSRDAIRARVFERGTGETLACGTGACAAVVAGQLRGMLDSEVNVEMPGGKLRVKWAGEGQPVYLSGPAVAVFEGTIEL